MPTPKSFLDMSDEELSDVNSSGFVIDDASTVVDETNEDKDTTSQDEADDAKVDDVADDHPDEDTQNDDEADKDADGSKEEDTPADDATKSDEADDNEKPSDEDKGSEKADPKSTKVDDGKDSTDTKVEDKKSDDKSAEIDYKAEYEKLIAPFKANGREIKVDNAEDAKALMQMGANYNKKMAALKPSLKILKLLENNGLLDEDKLSFLIDLDKKNPEAINKLVQDSGIDPMDITAEKAGEYKPSTYKVDDRELQLDEVIGELQGSPSFDRTLEVVGSKWDVASKQIVADAPQVLKIINDHMSSGIYDLIDTEMQKERMLGRLNGLSDIQAYKQVGDAMQEQGKFDSLNPSKVKESAKVAIVPVVVTPKLNKVDEDKLRDKKRAASSTKAAVPGAGKVTDSNLLALSDEEFSKIKPQYL